MQLNTFWRATLLGGLAAGVLDAIDALIAFKIVLGFNPVPIYQFVASGMLGPQAFAGGLATAGLGLGIHFFIAFTAALVYNLAATRVPAIGKHVVASGAAFGVAVYGVMNYLVIPLSAIGASPWSLALFVNGIVGHALLVGMPIAVIHSRLYPPPRSTPIGASRAARRAGT